METRLVCPPQLVLVEPGAGELQPRLATTTALQPGSTLRQAVTPASLPQPRLGEF